MKRCFWISIAVIAAVFITTPAVAYPLSTGGHYDLTNGVANGYWEEAYNGPYNRPGEPGVALRALSVNSDGQGTQWLLQGTILFDAVFVESGSDGMGDYDMFTTDYALTLTLLDGGPWGTGATVDLFGTNLTKSYAGEIAFEMTAAGPKDGLTYQLFVAYSGPDFQYPAGLLDDFPNGGHGSVDYLVDPGEMVRIYGFETIDLSVTPVPAPVALLLFGSGLVGVVGISRKKIQTQ